MFHTYPEIFFLTSVSISDIFRPRWFLFGNRLTAMDEESISANIKTLRIKKKMSLGELAKLTGLTRSYLSKVERSHRAPPLSTLNKIAVTLGVSLTFFLQEDTEKVEDSKLIIVRNGGGKKVITKGTLYGYEYEAIAHNKPGKNMEPFIIRPTTGREGTFKHEGEEFMYVLEGAHEFKYDGKKYIMKKGDSVYFDSGVPHSGRSLGGKKAKVLSIIYSYKR
jgi:transcriptional regulator with XRE-family HTH domain